MGACKTEKLGRGHSLALGMDTLMGQTSLCQAWLKRRERQEMDIRSPLDWQITGPGGKKIWKISRHGVVNKRDPNFHQAPEGAMRSLMQGGKEVHWWLPVPGCSGKWKMENGKLGRRSNTQQSGAGKRRQRLVRHIRGHSEGFSAPSAANNWACLLRWASTARAKKLQVGPRRLPPHPSRTTWSCSIWLPREEPLPRNNLHSKDLEGASGKEREMAGSHES